MTISHANQLTNLPYISELQYQLLRETLSRIVDATKPDKIICYGVRSSKIETWSCFIHDTDPVISADYDVLVITRERAKARREAVAQIIQNHNNASIRFTCLVHSLSAVNNALKQGNFFFSRLYHKGVMVYDDNSMQLAFPSETPIHLNPISTIESDWNKWNGLARKFYEGAEHALSKKANDLAVFMLHQAVEHACIALIRIYMGYRATTHKLGKLLAIVENFSFHSVTVFPRSTADEVKLFAVLEKAYVDARYKAEYSVQAGTINTLLAQVNKFLQIAEHLCVEKLNTSENSIGKLKHLK